MFSPETVWILLLVIGVGCVVVGIVGGGTKVLGIEIPAIASVPRQILLGAVGILFGLMALAVRPTEGGGELGTGGANGLGGAPSSGGRLRMTWKLLAGVNPTAPV